MSKDLWIAEVEQTETAYVLKEIDEDDFTARMHRLGFLDHEIQDMVSELKMDRDNG